MGAWVYTWMKSTCLECHLLMVDIVRRVLMENQFTTGE